MVDDAEWLGPNGYRPGAPPISFVFAKRQYALMQNGEMDGTPLASLVIWFVLCPFPEYRNTNLSEYVRFGREFCRTVVEIVAKDVDLDI